MKTNEPLTWCFVGWNATKSKPARILETREETLAYLSEPPPSGLDKWTVCSLYLCDFMDEIEKREYVYNATAIREFQKAHNLPVDGVENGSMLSALVYN